MTGTSTCATMSGTARAASSLLTVTRTSSEPASASARTCATVAATSAVSVLVIDWTTIGAPPPIRTLATSALRVWCLEMRVGSLIAGFAAATSLDDEPGHALLRDRREIERLAAQRRTDLGG